MFWYTIEKEKNELLYNNLNKSKKRIWKIVNNNFVYHFCLAFICLMLVIRVSRAHFIPFVNISRFIGQFEWYFEWAQSSKTFVPHAFHPTIQHIEQFLYARLHFTVRNVHFFYEAKSIRFFSFFSFHLCTFCFSFLSYQTRFKYFATQPNPIQCSFRFCDGHFIVNISC